MTKALTRLLAGVTDDEVANLVRMFDADNSGQVERDDFVEFVAKALEENA
jgi:Ca2+-binding EF-hand superfamily protein